MRLPACLKNWFGTSDLRDPEAFQVVPSAGLIKIEVSFGSAGEGRHPLSENRSNSDLAIGVSQRQQL